MRPGNTAEAITPIIVARTTGAQPIGVSGSAARSVSCQEAERSSSDSAISTSASATQPGVAVIRAWPMRCRPRRESANATSPATRITATTTPARAPRPSCGVAVVGSPVCPSRGVYQSGGAARRAIIYPARAPAVLPADAGRASRSVAAGGRSIV